ncbi:nucleoside-diphosphate-sugar epimerase [Pedobacter sp. AK017]|uniref:NAD-dependent epimerase/dehydratase family protein n=1 Tax=Pedobacter sp. AK017 TaxID=2723073 RepID=UPI001620B879|nr:NAD-dependent epimerase/dehydratase family protein [Pedobacter sp. AK017]MBB5436574.1 nucleoside-diphosphate-sugar epimerase [Pedobacter sp. AK017]
MTELEQLEQELLKPSDRLIADLRKIEGDIMLLGVGGKMGPSMAKLAKLAIDEGGLKKRIIGVSRFSDTAAREDLEAAGIETISADLLNEDDLAALPDAANIIYLAGTKFGTTGKEAFTWAMNAYLPGRVAERFKGSNIVVFSTGNVYPFTPVTSGGLSEDHPVAPVGEYGQSCLGRERIFQHFSEKNNTPVLIYRLNYAIDLRYGVLLEIAKAVNEGRAIDLTTGNVNVIWQGDANEIAIRSLLHCSTPAKVLNVTGPETLSVKWLAEQFGLLMNKQALFENEVQPTALLNNASEAHKLFGYPRVTIREMLEMTVSWLQGGGKISNKPTHFQERKGQF